MFKNSEVKNISYTNLLPGAFSVKDIAPSYHRGLSPQGRKIHDAGFAFLQNSLAKIDKEVYKPLSNVTYQIDAKGCIEVGSELVDSVEYYSEDYTGLADTINNLFGAKGNVIPTVTGGLIQGTVKVHTFQIAKEISFFELEKLAGKNIPVSIESVYQNLVQTAWDLFVNRAFYTGVGDEGGLLNHSKVKVEIVAGLTTAQIAAASDATMVALINTMLKKHLENTNYNPELLPDTLIAPMAVVEKLANSVNALYTDYLINFLTTHNLIAAYARGVGINDYKLNIVGRAQANTQGTAGVGRFVLYKKDKRFLKLHIPYDFKAFHTGPDMTTFSYRTLFIGQVAQLQLPYNESNLIQGAVTYWDFSA